jgi:death-on-curing family protein
LPKPIKSTVKAIERGKDVVSVAQPAVDVLDNINTLYSVMPLTAGESAGVTVMNQLERGFINPFTKAAVKKGFDAISFADEIVAINRATDGGGVLLNSTPSSAINSAMYYESVAEQGAAIFRSISHGHMFVNGNKRTAVAAFQSFAKQNKLTTVSQTKMMNVAEKVATGEITDVSEIAKC